MEKAIFFSLQTIALISKGSTKSIDFNKGKKVSIYLTKFQGWSISQYDFSYSGVPP